MEELEYDPEDERYTLLCNMKRHQLIYQTERRTRVTRGLENWIYEGMNPDAYSGGRPYSFVSDCCTLSNNIQYEIFTKYYIPVRHHFHRFFPELDTLVAKPAEYLGVVKRITAGMKARSWTISEDLLLDLRREGLLPPYAVAAVRSSLSACPRFLGPKTIARFVNSCRLSFALDSMCEELDAFVLRGGRIGLLAPNLSALVGSAVAAKLIGASGSLSDLADMRPPDIPLLSYGFCAPDNSTATRPDAFLTCPEHEKEQHHLTHDVMRGYVAQTGLIRSIPQRRLRIEACHSLAMRISKAAAIDLNGTDPTGETGRAFGEEMRTMIEKLKDVTELTEIPKKVKLAVSKDYCKMFKPKLSKEKSQYYHKMENNRAEWRRKRRNNKGPRGCYVIPSDRIRTTSNNLSDNRNSERYLALL